MPDNRPAWEVVSKQTVRTVCRRFLYGTRRLPMWNAADDRSPRRHETLDSCTCIIQGQTLAREVIAMTNPMSGASPMSMRQMQIHLNQQ